MSGKSNVIFWLEKRGYPADEETVERIFAKAKAGGRGADRGGDPCADAPGVTVSRQPSQCRTAAVTQALWGSLRIRHTIAAQRVETPKQIIPLRPPRPLR
jgi:hypothetical protein